MSDFLCGVEERRLQAALALDPIRQRELSQFFTPISVAQHMASLLSTSESEITLLDAGTGVGILFAAAVETLCLRPNRPQSIAVLAVEADPFLVIFAEKTLADCQNFASKNGIAFTGKIICDDFLSLVAQEIQPGLLDSSDPFNKRPNIAILNPPYRKITANSQERQMLRQLGIETTNLYTGFIAAALRLLTTNAEMVAITPRSFCNGSYFLPFRDDLLRRTALTHLHLFRSRTDAFQESTVLQETLIFRALVGADQSEQVEVAHLQDILGGIPRQYFAFSRIVQPGDAERYIRIPGETLTAPERLPFTASLIDVGLKVSTGRVVDFRAADFLCQAPSKTTAPLIYPVHCQASRVCWPNLETKKPNGLLAHEATKALRVPNGNYVLVKRFSAKEQPRRIMAFVYEASRFPDADRFGVGFENHLNYFHESGKGMDLALAHGLMAYLNSDEVDHYFRQFSGHTQVNATDLKNLSYPSRDELCELGLKNLGSIQ